MACSISFNALASTLALLPMERIWWRISWHFRLIWSMVSLVLVPPCTAGAVFVERVTGWQVWGAVLVVYIASLFGAIVIPAKRFE